MAADDKLLTAGQQHDQGTREGNAGTVYGETDAGRQVTLWDAERHNFKSGLSGAIQEEFWHCSWVCFGSHVASADDRILTGFQVTVDDLYYLTNDGRFCVPQWAKIEGIDNAGEPQPNGTFMAPYILPVVGGVKADVACGVTSTASYSVFTNATRPWLSEATEAMPDLKLDMMTRRTRSGPSITLQVDAWTRIDPAIGPASARDLLQETQPILALVSLSTFSKCGVTSMSAVATDDARVSILSHLGQPGNPESSASKNSVFTFQDLSLEAFLTTWDRLGEEPQARYARNLVVGQIGHSPLMVEEHISQVLGAAEGFQRWCLKGGSSPTLRNRLIDLHNGLPEPLQTRIGLSDVVDKWAGWAVWARNHVDHGGSEKHRHIADFYQLKVIADSVRLVTYLAMLQEFGIREETVQEALRNHGRLKVLAGRCAQIADLPAL